MDYDNLILSEDGKTLIGIKDKSVTKVVIPDGVEVIGEGAFSWTSLKCIDIPSSVTTIEKGAFRWCKSLQSIHTIGENLYYTSIDGILFSKDKSIIIRVPEGKDISEYKVPNNVKMIGDWAFCDSSSLQSIKMPNSVTTIGNSAFYECESLQSIDIPNSVTTIEDNAFYGCN